MVRHLMLPLLLLVALAARAADPLPSWREGPARTAILDFLDAVTDPAGADFVPARERVAVIDNDGTFWCERPEYVPTAFQVQLMASRAAAGVVSPDSMPYRAWLAGDRDALREYGYDEAYQALIRSFAGMSVEAFADSARAFLARQRHERFGVPPTELYYLPMLELHGLLAAHGFQVWVVTGGEQGFVRSYLEAVVGIPPERVIGSWTPPVYHEEQDGTVRMLRGDEQVYNGHEHKPANIQLRIGRRPIFAAGNSNNDQAMCRWSATGPQRSLSLWIRHDDDVREYAYDRGTDRIAALAAEHPRVVEVSMARDWARVFAREE
jgi:hypothetical protein